MKCSKCGFENQSASKYCEKCGMKLEMSTGNSSSMASQKKPVSSKRTMNILVICVLVLLICVGGYFVLSKGNTNDTSKFSFAKGYLLSFINPHFKDFTGDSLLIYNGEAFENEKYSYQLYETWNENLGYYEYIDNLYCNLDGTVNLIFENQLLNIVGKEKAIKNVTDFLISESGNSLVYESNDGVFLYDIQKEEAIEIVKNGTIQAISPDGKSVVYVTEDEVYLYSAKGVHCIGSTDINVVELSDSTEHIYYYKGKSLYVYNGITNEEQLISDNGAKQLDFNVSHTQIKFRDDANNWYITNESNEKIFITSDIEDLTLLTPEFAYETKNFFERFYYDDTTYYKSLYYVDKSGKFQLVADQVSEAKINQSGNIVYIVKNNELFYAKESDLSNIVSVTKDVRDFITTFDNAVYYTDSSRTLWYKDGKEEAIQIAEDVDTDNSESQVVITHDNYVLFLTNPVTPENAKESCKLYYSKGGSEKELIADNVTGINAVAGATYYYSDPERQQIAGTTTTTIFADVYFSLEGIEFERVED